MGTVDDMIAIKQLSDDAEEALHDAIEYLRIGDFEPAIEKAEEAAADLKTLEARKEEGK